MYIDIYTYRPSTHNIDTERHFQNNLLFSSSGFWHNTITAILKGAHSTSACTGWKDFGLGALLQGELGTAPRIPALAHKPPGKESGQGTDPFCPFPSPVHQLGMRDSRFTFRLLQTPTRPIPDHWPPGERSWQMADSCLYSSAFCFSRILPFKNPPLERLRLSTSSQKVT